MFINYFVSLETKSKEKLKWQNLLLFLNKIGANKNSPRKPLKDKDYKNKKSESSNFVLAIVDQNCRDQKTIANYFNSFFTTIAYKRIQKNPLGSRL